MAFNIPVQNTLANVRPSSPPTPWTRQPDWVAITSVPDTEIYYLVSDQSELRYTLETEFTGTGNLYIDWGDGSPTDIISSGSAIKTTHTYITGTGTPCSLGYTTWKITVSTDPVLTMTKCLFQNPTTGGAKHTCGVLEAWFGGALTSLDLSEAFNTTSRALEFPLLEYCKTPTTTLLAGKPISFAGCSNLNKVDYYTSLPYTTSQQFTFYQCLALQEMTFPADMINVSDFTGTFTSCYALYEVVMPASMNNVSTMESCFFNCTSLSKIQLPALPACTNFLTAFRGASSLIEFNFPGLLSSSGTINFGATFENCVSLQNVTFPQTLASGVTFTFGTCFSGCSGLTRIQLPSNVDLSTLSAAFTGCYSLQECILPSSCPSLVSFATAFQNCVNLQNITLPTTVSGTAQDFSNTFNNCKALTSVTIPSSYTLANLSSTFNACGARTITLPNNAQNSVTSMSNMCNNATNLKSIVLPTEMANCTTASSAFSGCFVLEELTMPSVMTTVATMSSLCNSARALNRITLPVSCPALTAAGMATMFTTCYSLLDVTLPATVNAAVSSFSQTFQNCWALRSVTLPTTQMTGITAAGLQNMFGGCYSLRTVANMEKLGNPATGSTIYAAATTMFGGSTTPNERLMLQAADFSLKLSALVINGTAGEPLNFFTSLRLRNTGSGQYAGSAPQINISYTALNQAALVQVFNDLPTVTGKSIDITAAAGAASLTAGERAIATGKGWTIIG